MKKQSTKKRRTVKLPTGLVFAHGATRPVVFEVLKTRRRKQYWPELAVRFGTTVACDNHQYPVAFYRLDDIRGLHTFLGQCIAYAEAKGLR